MSKNPPQIACLGSIVADTVGKPIDALPKKGTLEVIDRVELHVGGNGSNTAAALAKLGTPVVAFGRVGRDNFGAFLLSTLAGWGVDTGGITIDPEAPTAATIVTVHSDAERTFIHATGANATYQAEHFTWEALEGVRIFHLAGLQLMTGLEGDGVASIMQEAKRRGVLTTLDTVMNPRSRYWEGLVAAIPHIDWLLPSQIEAEKLTGESDPASQVAVFRAAGATNVVIKMGEEGCYLAPHGQVAIRVPAFPVNVIDSLGAGDSWCAGFLTGLLEGWDLEKTARVANAVGACCVQSLGATTGIRPLSETLTLIGA